MSKKMFAAVYGDEAAVRALLQAEVPGAEGILTFADIVLEKEMSSLEQAMAHGQTAGIAVHRAVIAKRDA